jgi:hypothetical protein
MNFLPPTLALALLLSLSSSSQATVSFYALKDAYDVNPANPQVYRYDGISNFRSGTQASITTRTTGHGYSSDIAIDEQGRFYFVSGLPTDTSTKQIWYWNSVADWAANTNGGLLGQRTTTFQISGFSVYNNELYFLEGNPDGSGNKTLRKWASAASWANGDAGTTLGTRSTGTGLGFEIDAGGAVWYLGSSAQTATSGTLYRWNSINDFLNNTNQSDNGGSFNFTFSGSTDQIAGLAVPEPSSSLLLLTSLATLPLFRRRSR